MTPDTVWFGEIALTGEVRPVAHGDARLREAGKLGFGAAVMPPRHRGGTGHALRLDTVSHVGDLAGRLARSGHERRVRAHV